MSITNKLTGKSGSLTINGTTIPWTKIEPSVDRTLAEATDSTDYDSGSDMLWTTQLPVKMGMKLSVEGRYNTSTIPSAVLAILFAGATAQPVVIKLNPTTTWGHGSFDISNFKVTLPVDDIVAYSMELTLNGVWTSGS